MDASIVRDLVPGDGSKTASLACAVEVAKAYASSTAAGLAPETIAKCVHQVFEKIEELRGAK